MIGAFAPSQRITYNAPRQRNPAHAVQKGWTPISINFSMCFNFQIVAFDVSMLVVCTAYVHNMAGCGGGLGLYRGRASI